MGDRPGTSLAARLARLAAVLRASARGVRLAADVVERTLAHLDGAPPASTTSMRRDLAAGRPSELFDQTGAIVRLGLHRSREMTRLRSRVDRS